MSSSAGETLWCCTSCDGSEEKTFNAAVLICEELNPSQTFTAFSQAFLIADVEIFPGPKRV